MNGSLFSCPQDWFNQFAHGVVSNASIQLVLKLEGRLKSSLVKKAAEIFIEMEPVLECRFVVENNIPLWKRIESLTPEKYYRLVETERVRQEIDSFIAEDIDTEKSPGIILLHVRSSARDWLCIKTNHSCCDGGSVRYCLNRLADIYSVLEKRKKYHVKEHTADRSLQPVLDSLGIKSSYRFFDPSECDLESTWSVPGGSRCDHSNISSRYVGRQLEPYLFEPVVKKCREENVSVNDLILAAFYRVLRTKAGVSIDGEREMQFMTDMRKYLPDGSPECIRNLSSIANVKLHDPVEEDFTKSVKKVSARMKAVMRNQPDIHGAIGMELMRPYGYEMAREMFMEEWNSSLYAGKSTPMFSNLGLLSSEKIRFGKTPVGELTVVPPAFRWPGFMLCAGTYAGSLTMGVSFCEPERTGHEVGYIIDEICSYLYEFSCNK